jgi:hypothetical protein
LKLKKFNGAFTDMNDHSQHITHYSAADIQRYLSGNMSASEMHAMERAALDDPFLADAIEGMEQALQSHGAAPVNDNLQELRTAVAEKVHPGSGKVRVMVWWKMAAAAIVVIVAGLFLWDNYFDADHAQKVAAVQTQEKNIAPQVPATDSSRDAVAPATTEEGLPSTFSTADVDKNAKGNRQEQLSKAESNNAEAEKSVKDARSLAQTENGSRSRTAAILPRTNEKQIPLDSNVPATIVPDGYNKKDLVLQSETKAAQFNFSDTVGRPVRTEIVGALQGHTPGLVIQSNADQRKLNNVIRGRVIDNAYKPIPNANLNANNAGAVNNTYFTDREGYFNIPVPALDTGALNVSVTASGFNTQQFRLNAAVPSANNLQLQPVEQFLAETIITGYGKTKAVSRKIKETDLLQQNAEPVTGWTSYENYLRQNNRLNRDSARAVRDVVVSFVVNRRGELSDFTVTSGSTTEANAEALRLIKEGPAWKLKRGRKATATVIVHF